MGPVWPSGASLLGTRAAAGDESGAGGYPPARTGLRGSHPGSWETMHARVAGRTWPAAPTDETYDLVVVGGGISGLSAAVFYRSRHPDARILILDNHDDVGGHAKRNEFRVGGRTLVGYGGTESIDTPGSYSEVSLGLLDELGVDLQRFYDYYDQDLYDRLQLSPRDRVRRLQLRGVAAGYRLRQYTLG